ncbi:MAG: hypothetical protein IKY48_01755 [Bacteroidales bacterium]|nr:hypothetical protein [Bacteroidales bacterium]
MKLKLATILFAVSVMITGMTSCSKENLGEAQLPPLAGEVVLTDVLATDGSRVAPNYILGVEFGTEGATKDGSGAVLDVKFVSNAPTLAAGKYTEASASTAISGNFITGAEGTKLYLNGKKYLVTAGTIEVKNDGTSYSLSAIVKLSNGENYSLKCAGVALAWTGLPVMKVLNTVMSAQSNVANGTKSVTLNLGDGNFTAEMDMTTYQTVYKGAGNYLAIDLYSEDGYLAAGTYKPCAQGGVINKGEYGIGWDPGDIYNIGMAFENWGTCWWTVDENATPQTSAQKITTGDITVALNGTTYTITVDNGELLAQFVGEIPQVTKPAEPADPWEISGSIVFQHEGLSYTMTDDTANNQTSGGAALEGVSLYWVQINDAAGNLVAELDLVTKAGATSLAGEYKVTSYPDEVGEAGNGFYIDLGAMGWGEGVMSGGTILYGPDGTANVVDAETSKIKITENKGQTTIIVKGTSNGATIAGKYVIGEIQEDEGGEGEGSGCGCDCDGCKDCTGGGEGGDDDEGGAFNGVTLAGVGGWIDYGMFGMNMLGLDFYSTGCTVTNSWWQYTYEGTGYHLKLELYCEGGVVTPGVYQITTVASAPEPNQVKAGDDSGGSEWYSVTDGTATLVGKITDGTVTIEQSGDIYTVTIQSSVCNAQYVGPLAAPAQ